MNSKVKFSFITSLLAIITLLFTTSCELENNVKPKSNTGVVKAKANVKVQASGLTVEQENIKKRIETENNPGTIKHLYIISPYSGQVIIYSTVKGKVTSSGKRLTPYSVSANYSTNHTSQFSGFGVNFGGETKRTSEVLQDDGTYGSSIPYLYWWDVQGRYHQQYVAGGMIIHISDTPIPVKSITINMEVTDNKK